MKESLHVKNFGPIINIEIAIKTINIFTGTPSSGKSTVAKLISIFKSGQLNGVKEPFEYFQKLLANYNINFKINPNTYIKYQVDDFIYEITDNKVETNQSIKGKVTFLIPIYIPAKRVFFPTLSQSIFGLINSDISPLKQLIDFGAKFEKARSAIKRFPIDFLKANYELRDANVGTVYSSGESDYSVLHETGHLLSLSDQYVDDPSDYGPPYAYKKGVYDYATDLMATNGQFGFNSSYYQSFLNKASVLLKTTVTDGFFASPLISKQISYITGTTYIQIPFSGFINTNLAIRIPDKL